jgi:predicted nucleic acid-binding protein
MGAAWVFDSYALLALFQGEPAGQEVRSLLVQSSRSSAPIWMTTINLGEIWYSLARAHSRREADEAVNHIRRLRFQLRGVDLDLALAAADLKSRFPLSYADCCGAALARELGAAIVTGDPEFRAVEKEVRVHWLAAKPRRT